MCSLSLAKASKATRTSTPFLLWNVLVAASKTGVMKSSRQRVMGGKIMRGRIHAVCLVYLWCGVV